MTARRRGRSRYDMSAHPPLPRHVYVAVARVSWEPCCRRRSGSFHAVGTGGASHGGTWRSAAFVGVTVTVPSGAHLAAGSLSGLLPGVPVSPPSFPWLSRSSPVSYQARFAVSGRGL
ncbi:MAG: hypothetical protein WDW38_003259 [Sanguina aurantia]